MADTSPQHWVEAWVVREALPKIYGQSFSKASVELAWGGSFEFDAVSSDKAMVACVSTNCCRTASGRNAIGKFHKIRADALYLLNATGVGRRALVFTDAGMKQHFERERARGRFPSASQIELQLVELPDALSVELQAARERASFEVSPGQASRP